MGRTLGFLFLLLLLCLVSPCRPGQSDSTPSTSRPSGRSPLEAFRAHASVGRFKSFISHFIPILRAQWAAIIPPETDTHEGPKPTKVELALAITKNLLSRCMQLGYLALGSIWDVTASFLTEKAANILAAAKRTDRFMKHLQDPQVIMDYILDPNEPMSIYSILEDFGDKSTSLEDLKLALDMARRKESRLTLPELSGKLYHALEETRPGERLNIRSLFQLVNWHYLLLDILSLLDPHPDRPRSAFVLAEDVYNEAMNFLGGKDSFVGIGPIHFFYAEYTSQGGLLKVGAKEAATLGEAMGQDPTFEYRNGPVSVTIPEPQPYSESLSRWRGPFVLPLDLATQSPKLPHFFVACHLSIRSAKKRQESLDVLCHGVFFFLGLMALTVLVQSLRYIGVVAVFSGLLWHPFAYLYTWYWRLGFTLKGFIVFMGCLLLLRRWAPKNTFLSNLASFVDVSMNLVFGEARSWNQVVFRGFLYLTLIQISHDGLYWIYAALPNAFASSEDHELNNPKYAEPPLSPLLKGPIDVDRFNPGQIYELHL